MQLLKHLENKRSALVFNVFNDKLLRQKWPVTLIEYVDVVAGALEKENVDNAQELAIKTVMALANFDGGRVHYLPKGDTLKKALRDKAIFSEFKGHNHHSLASKHRLTVKQIYAIISEQRELHTIRKQPWLFDDE